MSVDHSLFETYQREDSLTPPLSLGRPFCMSHKLCYILAMTRRIYLDYASLTPIDPRVVKETGRYSVPAYANPSSLYMEGVAAKNAVATSRASVAEAIHAHGDEIVFTSGGTEANNLALCGVVQAARAGGISKPHVIISAIEHSSIMEMATALEGWGCEVTRVPVDHSGVIDLTQFGQSLKDTTVLVSIMTVNNEVGSVQPIREIAKIIRTARTQTTSAYPLFHTDAAQAFLYHDLFVEKLGVDLLTLDGSKIYGPRGIGCLYVKRNTPIVPISYGGGQERGLRSGTENVSGIAGFAKAIQLAIEGRIAETKRLSILRASFIEGLKNIRESIIVNGTTGEAQSPHIVNVSIPGIDNEFFLFQLDARGIACSTKSSCLRDEEESYVLRAMNVESRDSLRFSFGRWTKKGDVKATLKVLQALLAS